MVSRYSAIKRLGRRTEQEYRGPVQLGGLGVKAESKYGIYQVRLPLCSSHKKVSRHLTEKKQDLTKISIILMVLTKI